MNSNLLRLGSLLVFIAIGLAFIAIWQWPSATDEMPSVVYQPAEVPAPKVVQDEAKAPVRPSIESSLAIVPPKVVFNKGEGPTAMRFSGRVVDRSHQEGIAGAQLQFSGGGGVVSVMADQKGYFVFRPSEPGIYQLVAAEADGFTPFAPSWGFSPMRFVAQPGHMVSGIIIHLLRTVELTVHVVNQQNEPIERSKLQIIGAPSSVVESSKITYTDANGETKVSTSVGALIEVSHSGYHRQRHVFTRRDQQRGSVQIRLASLEDNQVANQSLSGRVVDDENEPIADTEVIATPVEMSLPSPWNTPPWWRTISQSDGTFTFSNLPNSGYTLSFSHPDFVPTQYAPAMAGSTGIQVTMSKNGGRVYGKVMGADDKQPIGGFVLVVSKALGAMEEQIVYSQSFFSSEGNYEIGPLSPGQYRLRALAHGYASARPPEFSLSNGDNIEVDILLEQGGKITGFVINKEQQNPIAGASISLEGNLVGSAIPLPVDSQVQADDSGYFELTGIHPGTRSINVSAEGFHSRIVSGIALTQSGQEVGPIEIQLTPTKADEEAKIELVGIGAALGPQGDHVVVGQTLEEGGAAKAGMQPGDLIIEIDGEGIQGKEFGEVIQLIRGPEGTTVDFKIMRNGEALRLTVPRLKVRA